MRDYIGHAVQQPGVDWPTVKIICPGNTAHELNNQRLETGRLHGERLEISQSDIKRLIEIDRDLMLMRLEAEQSRKL